MPPILPNIIRDIQQRLRALETREYTEVGGPATVCFEQYIEHCGDPNTFINFQPDNFQVDVGGKTALFLDAVDTNVLLGADAGQNIVAADRDDILIGYEAGYNLTTGVDTILIGSKAGYTLTTGESNIAIGYQAMQLTGINASQNVAIGTYALQDVGKTGGGDMNTAIGWAAQLQQDTGEYNVAVGAMALQNSPAGSGNTALGTEAMASGTGTPVNNVAIGYQAMFGGGISPTGNIAIGMKAGLSLNTGNYNVAIGMEAMYYNAASHNNIVIGYRAGYKGAATTYDNCVLIGYQAGYLLGTGDNNIAIGYRAGDNLTTGTGNIIIGYDLDAPIAAGSDQLYIGGIIYANLSTMRVGVGTVVPLAKVHIDQSVDNAAIPVLILDQADVSEEFMRLIGASADGVLTQSLVEEGDQGSATLAGWFKIYVDDVGDQITDAAYYVPFYTLA